MINDSSIEDIYKIWFFIFNKILVKMYLIVKGILFKISGNLKVILWKNDSIII